MKNQYCSENVKEINTKYAFFFKPKNSEPLPLANLNKQKKSYQVRKKSKLNIPKKFGSTFYYLSSTTLPDSNYQSWFDILDFEQFGLFL